MPRIDAATIEEHVRLQTARILDAASSLFRSRGYRRTDLEDIAQAVGLARNSLYRYYPGKDHLLLACVRRDMAPYLERLRLLETEHSDPRRRLTAWLDAQLDIATGPTHATLELIGEIRDASPDLRRDILALHASANSVLESAVTELLRGRRRNVELVTALIAGMTTTAAMQAIRRGNVAAVKRELRRAVQAVVDDRPGAAAPGGT